MWQVNTKRYKYLAMAGDEEDVGLEWVKTTGSDNFCKEE